MATIRGGGTDGYAVGDVYYKEDTPIGVVFEVAEDNNYIKIVALEEQFLAHAVDSGTAVDFTGTFDENDGMVNLEGWDDFLTENYGYYTSTDFPAFNYCANYRGENQESYEWYVPAKNEMSKIRQNLGTINNALGTITESIALQTSYSYWTSTFDSSATNKAYYVAMLSGNVSTANATTSCYVRPVRKIDLSN